MNARLIRHGDDLVLVIDPALLHQLKIDENTALEVTVEGDHLVVTPNREQPPGISFEEALLDTNERYGKTLRRLAE